MRLIGMLLMAVSAVPQMATAVKSAKPAPVKIKHINIEEEDIVEGANVRPEGDVIGSAKRRTPDSLITERTSFTYELVKSAETL